MSAYGQNAENRERQVMGYLLNDGINEEGECNSYSLSDIANATGIDNNGMHKFDMRNRTSDAYCVRFHLNGE